MPLKKAKERDKKMLGLLDSWMKLEEHTIKSCSNISGKTRNPLIKTLITAIKNDSQKHKAIIKLITDSMTKKALVLTPDELKGISSLLNRHITIEQKSIDLAEETITVTRDATARQLLKLILEDEKKHAKLVEQINELKFRVTASVT